MKRFLWIGAVILFSVGALFAQPRIHVPDSLLYYGEVAVGHEMLDTVRAYNIGDETLVLDVEVTGDAGSDGFWLGRRTHFEIAPQGNPAYIEVGFSPQSVRRYWGTMIIHTNCTDSLMQEVDVPLIGDGVAYNPPPHFSLISPARGDTVQAGDVELIWQTLQVDETVNYTVHLMAADSTRLTFGPVTDTTFTVPNGSLADGMWYDWYVVATYGTHTLNSNNYGYFRYGFTPDFELMLPANGSRVPAGDVHLMWQQLNVEGPVQYTAHVVRDGQPELTYGPMTETTCVVPEGSLTNNHMYSWYVVATYGTNTRHSLSTFYFVYAYEPPPSFHLVSPENRTEINTAAALFTWTSLTPRPGGTTTYRLRIQQADTAQGQFSHIYDAGTDTSFTVSFDDYENNIAYVWWVDADNDRYSYPSDEGWTFELSLPPITNGVKDPNATVLPKRLEIASVYPNPFNPETQIRLLVPNDGVVRAEIFDMLGREVAVLINAPLSAGEHHLTWRASGSSGIYLLRVSDLHGGVAVQKLMVVR